LGDAGQRGRAAWERWLLALAIGLVAATTRWLIDGFVDSGPFLTFFQRSPLPPCSADDGRPSR
jgi:hypothetical protein